jgi:CheY-like chemotaxis protein
MAGETILVVDDAPVSLKLAATVLRSEGYKVHLACSAEEALMILRTMVPDLLLVDIQLPGMNGLELTRQLRQDPRTREMLIVALTASVMVEAEQLAYDAGCDGFIAKPIDTRSLGRRLRCYLDSHSAAAPELDIAQGGLLRTFDALIAATAIDTGLTLVSKNRKHFQMIGELDLEVPDY